MAVSEMRWIGYALLAAAALGASPSDAQIYAAERSTEAISEQDLLALIRISDIRFVRYDYEFPFDFCFNVYVETSVDADQAIISPSGHLCQLSGPQRLMIIWQRSGDEVRVVAHTHRRDGTAVGGSTSKIMQIPNVIGNHESIIPLPRFSLGEKVLVADFTYTTAGQSTGSRSLAEAVNTRLKVFVELRANTDQSESAGGRLIE
ncbi:MAG: hypothetical protein ACYS8I_00285 [Planctomycetota bacterium]|jgi:hypothetical protein